VKTLHMAFGKGAHGLGAQGYMDHGPVPGHWADIAYISRITPVEGRCTDFILRPKTQKVLGAGPLRYGKIGRGMLMWQTYRTA